VTEPAPARLASPTAIEDALVDVEDTVGSTVEWVIRRFAVAVEKTVLELLAEDPSLTASAHQEGLGHIEDVWADMVASNVLPALQLAWTSGATATVSASGLTSDRLVDAARTEYLRTSGDRLVRGISPPLPSQAWELISTAIDQELRAGAGLGQISRRIAAEMSWDVDTVFWEQRKASIAAQIDSILDPISTNPRDPVRQAARLNDPQVRELQRQNALVTQRLDAEKSFWQVRSDRIARTEVHGAFEHGSMSSMARVGVQVREWLTASDDRVREDHVMADGQRVAMDEPFMVGGEPLMYPGDPSGSAENVINCRCVAVGADPGDIALFPELEDE
jgi:hypothetical protein